MDITFIEEFTRIGGGQIAFINVYNAIHERFSKKILYTDKHHPKLPPLKFDKIIEGSYTYSESDPLIVFPFRILREKRRLKKAIYTEFSFNNHPNVFVYNATFNFAHENFLYRFLDENGKVKNSLAVKLLRVSKLYDEYNNSRIIVPGNYAKEMTLKSLELLGVTPKEVNVINLPVDLPEVNIGEERDECVLTFGRISKDKRLEVVIEIAKRLPKTRFIIAGAVNKGSEGYLKYLEKNSPKNLIIIKNVSEELKDSLFRKCKVYLHARRNDFFPLSVVEAIAYGLIPVVPKAGGPWIDIVEKGKFGLGYDSVEEAVDSILQAFSLSKSHLKEIYESRYRFSFALFKNRINELIDKVL